ncbi:MAG TPA: hypothetical protein VFW53_01795 [Gallionella sp.]|nr:hypothetical protein [Gallionella sp.]
MRQWKYWCRILLQQTFAPICALSSCLQEYWLDKLVSGCLTIKLNRFQCTDNSTSSPCRIDQLMLPNSDDFPPEFAQLAAYISVPLAIGVNLGIPIFPVAARASITFRASVPKAAIHKYSDPLAPECEVWLAPAASRHTPPAETFVLVGWNKGDEPRVPAVYFLQAGIALMDRAKPFQ